MSTPGAPSPRRVEITAHRGSSMGAPENSLSALRQAIADGADWAEVDVQETADGVLVLLHDADLRRVAGCDARIWELPFAEVRALDAGSWFSPHFAGEPIATLAEALDLARGRIGLNLELKDNGHQRHLAERTAELVRARAQPGRCLITSASPILLRRVRAAAPEVPIGLVVTAPGQDAGDLRLDLVSLHLRLATPERVRANRAAGLATHVWTVNDPAEMRRLIALGVDNLITDQPALLRRILADRPGPA